MKNYKIVKNRVEVVYPKELTANLPKIDYKTLTKSQFIALLAKEELDNIFITFNWIQVEKGGQDDLDEIIWKEMEYTIWWYNEQLERKDEPFKEFYNIDWSKINDIRKEKTK